MAGRANRKWHSGQALLAMALMVSAPLAQAATNVLFIGNSFTFGYGSALRYYRAATVRDLNDEGQGGVPALFKSFTQQAGLDYNVALETRGGTGIDWHVANRAAVILQQPWDIVVAHGHSTLDAEHPGNPARLVESVQQLAVLLVAANRQVDLRLEATFPRADQTYLPGGAWQGKTVADMARDVRAGYALAASASPAVRGIIPVGEAWIRAFDSGLADRNPYDGIEAGKLNLWTYDNYHASVAGYYLKGLVVFGSLTGRDPRTLGASECSGFELGLSALQVKALEQVAFEQLAASDGLKAATAAATATTGAPPPGDPLRCRPAGS
jgi:hypothetical protein